MSNLIVVSVDPTHADHKKPITLTDDERYKYCGFRNLNELKDYATHMGKTYSGTSFDECYTLVFGKNATEVANINKARHSKFVKPVSVKDRLDKKRERIERLEQANNDNIPILVKLEQFQIRLEREDIFNKIGDLNRKLVALESFKLNLENKPNIQEYNFLLDVPTSYYNYITQLYKLPITQGTNFTFYLTLFENNDETKHFMAKVIKYEKRSDGLEVGINFARTQRGMSWDYKFKCFLNVKECNVINISDKSLQTVSSEILYTFKQS